MGLQSPKGADLVDSSYDDAAVVTPSDTISSAHRLRGVRGLFADVGGNITVISNAAASKAETGADSTFGQVTGVAVTDPGSGNYTGATIAFTNGGGSGAAATVQTAGGNITGVAVTNGGEGYISAPTGTITPVGNGTGATVTAAVDFPSVSFDVKAGEVLPLRAAYVLSTGTDATGLKALF